MISLGISNWALRQRSFDLSNLPPTVCKPLLEAATWCSRQLILGEQLRSVQLDPSKTLDIPSFDSLGVGAWADAKRESYQLSTSAINRARSLLLLDAGAEIVDGACAQSKGRLLAYEALETVSDGAAEAASRGFFDVEDAPPWDTWFFYSMDTIFCWVPDSMISFAQAGIDANPVDCIHWAEWTVLPREVSR